MISSNSASRKYVVASLFVMVTLASSSLVAAYFPQFVTIINIPTGKIVSAISRLPLWKIFRFGPVGFEYRFVDGWVPQFRSLTKFILLDSKSNGPIISETNPSRSTNSPELNSSYSFQGTLKGLSNLDPLPTILNTTAESQMQSMAYDPLNGHIFIGLGPSVSSDQIAVFNDISGSFIANITIPICANCTSNIVSLTYDSPENLLYAADSDLDAVYVINASSDAIVDTITNLAANLVVSIPSGLVYSTNTSSSSLVLINDKTVTKSISLNSSLAAPEGMTYDPSNGDLYVTQGLYFTVVSTSTNAIVAEIDVNSVCSDCTLRGITYDTTNGLIYAGASYLPCLRSCIGGNGTIIALNTSTDSASTTFIIQNPHPPIVVTMSSVIFDAGNNQVYAVDREGDYIIDYVPSTGNYSMISLVNYPSSLAFDSWNGNLYVTSYNSSSDGFIFSTSTVAKSASTTAVFSETGLPEGANWSSTLSWSGTIAGFGSASRSGTLFQAVGFNQTVPLESNLTFVLPLNYTFDYLFNNVSTQANSSKYYMAFPGTASGDFVASAEATVILGNFVYYGYEIEFEESGLLNDPNIPAGIGADAPGWTVTLTACDTVYTVTKQTVITLYLCTTPPSETSKTNEINFGFIGANYNYVANSTHYANVTGSFSTTNLPAGTLVVPVQFTILSVGQAVISSFGNVWAADPANNTVDVYTVGAFYGTETDSIPVGQFPISLANLSLGSTADPLNLILSVNQGSDTVSVIDASVTPFQVVETVAVGNEPVGITPFNINSECYPYNIQRTSCDGFDNLCSYGCGLAFVSNFETNDVTVLNFSLSSSGALTISSGTIALNDSPTGLFATEPSEWGVYLSLYNSEALEVLNVLDLAQLESAPAIDCPVVNSQSFLEFTEDCAQIDGVGLYPMGIAQVYNPGIAGVMAVADSGSNALSVIENVEVGIPVYFTGKTGASDGLNEFNPGTSIDALITETDPIGIAITPHLTLPYLPSNQIGNQPSPGIFVMYSDSSVVSYMDEGLSVSGFNDQGLGSGLPLTDVETNNTALGGHVASSFTFGVGYFNDSAPVVISYYPAPGREASNVLAINTSPVAFSVSGNFNVCGTAPVNYQGGTSPNYCNAGFILQGDNYVNFEGSETDYVLYLVDLSTNYDYGCSPSICGEYTMSAILPAGYSLQSIVGTGAISMTVSIQSNLAYIQALSSQCWNDYYMAYPTGWCSVAISEQAPTQPLWQIDPSISVDGPGYFSIGTAILAMTAVGGVAIGTAVEPGLGSLIGGVIGTFTGIFIDEAENLGAYPITYYALTPNGCSNCFATSLSTDLGITVPTGYTPSETILVDIPIVGLVSSLTFGAAQLPASAGTYTEEQLLPVPPPGGGSCSSTISCYGFVPQISTVEKGSIDLAITLSVSGTTTKNNPNTEKTFLSDLGNIVGLVTDLTKLVTDTTATSPNGATIDTDVTKVVKDIVSLTGGSGGAGDVTVNCMTQSIQDPGPEASTEIFDMVTFKNFINIPVVQSVISYIKYTIGVIGDVISLFGSLSKAVASGFTAVTADLALIGNFVNLINDGAALISQVLGDNYGNTVAFSIIKNAMKVATWLAPDPNGTSIVPSVYNQYGQLVLGYDVGTQSMIMQSYAGYIGGSSTSYEMFLYQNQTSPQQYNITYTAIGGNASLPYFAKISLQNSTVAYSGYLSGGTNVTAPVTTSNNASEIQSSSYIDPTVSVSEGTSLGKYTVYATPYLVEGNNSIGTKNVNSEFVILNGTEYKMKSYNSTSFYVNLKYLGSSNEPISVYTISDGVLGGYQGSYLPPSTNVFYLTEEGLPTGTRWNATFDGVMQSWPAGNALTGNMIIFANIKPGKYSWNISSVPSGSPDVRYSPSSTSGTVHITSSSAGVAINFTTQYAENLSYYVSDGSIAPSSPEFKGVEAGSPYTTTLSTTPVPVWLDANSSWSVTPNTLAGSTSTTRWVVNSTDSTGLVSSPGNISVEYLHEDYVNFLASPSSSAGTTSPSGWYTLVGLQFSIKDKPASGWVFDEWESTPGIYIEEVSSKNALMNVTAPGNVTAVFEPGVSVTMSNSSITISPNGSAIDNALIKGAPQEVTMSFTTKNGISVLFSATTVYDSLSGVVNEVEFQTSSTISSGSYIITITATGADGQSASAKVTIDVT